MLLQQVINAISLGGIYALLALGLAIVFSITGLINFAHGELMTLSGYALLAALMMGMPLLPAAVTAVAAGALAAVAMERVAFRPMRGASVTSLLLTSFAVSNLLKVVFQNAISARGKPIAMPDWMAGVVPIGSFTIGVGPLMSIAVSALALLGLELFLRRTVMGAAMRAAAQDFNTLRLVGISANRVIAVAFLLSGVLAGIASLLWIAQRASVDPMMGFVPVLKAFIATVIGGLGSLSGAVAGGMLLGVMEVALQALLPPSLAPYRDALVLSGIIVVLLVRPNGLIPAVDTARS
ncbi:branched-chain amino acid transport system permease protein [Angulomicrobium tetraedrale]|uniref:Branched-chain amino acid transport system permease protein n=1 Tax=Ancylobacter tetraedralis TaxID=217068 RepID=A0A839Z8T1_9HYPH|nr:branched-chain amino acid ABC transporter permease [Ancylobacter tetraedralis]MBB3771410.1 branched-chain amino acid transport system permease protein [Ancylobacter tetraedralis]